jgi:hypothetical protein
MTDKLLELADRCEAATGPDRELDWLIYAATCGQDTSTVEPGHRYLYGEHYTASLDDAMSLLSDGSEYDLTNLYGVARAYVDLSNEYGGHNGEHLGGNLCLAFCAAALRARAAQ